MKRNEEQILGGLFGVCIGDALGLPVEGAPRKYLKKNPVKGFSSSALLRKISSGWWSDDSSLTLCFAESIVKSGIDLHAIAQKFSRWLYEGYWTPAGRAFGIGYTTATAIEKYRRGVEPVDAGGRDEYSNGNGSLMRILPLAFYLQYRRRTGAFDRTEEGRIIRDVSSITHAHPRSHIACAIYIQFALGLLGEDNPKTAYRTMREQIHGFYTSGVYRGELKHFDRILDADISLLSEEEVRSGGYVVDTLEAALWCFLKGSSFAETVLRAVNLGGDSDTTGSVTGGLAGLFYGYHALPSEWVNAVARKDDILTLGKRLARCLS